MVLGGCGNGADGARSDQFNGGRSTGQRQQHGGRPLDWEGTDVEMMLVCNIKVFSPEQISFNRKVDVDR